MIPLVVFILRLNTFTALTIAVTSLNGPGLVTQTELFQLFPRQTVPETMVQGTGKGGKLELGHEMLLAIIDSSLVQKRKLLRKF